MVAKIKKLQEQREQLHSSLGEFLEDVLLWAQAEHPELNIEVNRVSELMDALLSKIEHARTELDRIEKAGAEEFVRNYIQRPGK